MRKQSEQGRFEFGILQTSVPDSVELLGNENRPSYTLLRQILTDTTDPAFFTVP
jgi:hypothetical protein